MNESFHEIDISNWTRRQEFEYFSRGGCGFTMTAPVDISPLYTFSKKNGVKLYPLLVAFAVKVANAREVFRYGAPEGRLGVFDVVHPKFFSLSVHGDAVCLFTEYEDDPVSLAKNIERVQREFADAETYFPQGEPPDNTINISCVPWVEGASLNFCLQYCASFYPPILAFGRFSREGDKTTIPLNLYCNHAVNDGRHAALFFSDLQALIREYFNETTGETK